MKYIYLFLFLFFSISLHSQERYSISGKVTNAVTGAPIPNASVFINGTSKGTITNTNGNFYIGGIPAGSFEIVFSSVGYSTMVYAFTSDQLPLNLKMELKPKVMELDSVTVEPFDKDGWKNWGRFFLENFIGTSAAAKQCTIKNYKTLRFRHSKKRKTLEVVADEPLIIENKALGYRIQYQLEAFIHDWNTHSQVFVGFTLFEDMAEDRRRVPKRWIESRKQAYTGSLMHFMRSLYNNKLKEAGFEVQRMYKVINLEKERVRAIRAGEARRNIKSGGKIGMRSGMAVSPDSAAYYQQVLLQPDSLPVVRQTLLTADSLVSTTSDSSRILFFHHYLQVTSKVAREEEAYLVYIRQARKPWLQRSVVNLPQGSPVTIDHNGMYFPPQDLFLADYWGWSEKVAYLLPWDYRGE